MERHQALTDLRHTLELAATKPANSLTATETIVQARVVESLGQAALRLFGLGGTALALLFSYWVSLRDRVTIRDISEQVAAQKRILELNESLERQVAERTRRLEEASTLQRSILSHAGYALIATDPDGLITLFNPAAENMLGYSAAEVVRRVNLSLFHDPEELAASAAELEVFLGLKVAPDVHALFGRVARTTVDEKRWTYLCKDGKALPVQLRLSALKIEGGQTVGYLCIAVDYTEIDAREQALRQARAEAVSANHAKSQFLANMSHEIRTPMNAILGTLKLIRRMPPGRQSLQHLDIAESAARTLLGVIEDILDFSKIEAGKLKLAHRAFDLDSVLRDAAGMLSLSVGSKPLRLVFDIDPKLPKLVVGDALRLQQVLLNLIGNAVKFTSKGLVTAHLGCRRLTRADLELYASVQDDGVGMNDLSAR